MWPFRRLTKRKRCGLIQDPMEKEGKMDESKMESDPKTENTEQKSAEEAAQEAAADAAAAEQASAETPADEKTDEKADGQEQAGEAAPQEEQKPAAPDWKILYAHEKADFENYRKRMARDREEFVKAAARDVLKDMLTTVDNLARALEGAKDKAEDPFVKGVQLVYDGLVKTLADHGATPLDSVGEPFDTTFHEALAQLPSADVEEGVVMNEVKRGWLLHGKLLRAAQVVVSAGKGA